jgi:flagellar protein FliS
MMTQDEITTFNRRIASANPTELIKILFDIYFTYEQDALDALDRKDQQSYVAAVRHCFQVVRHLKDDLDFSYPVAADLYSLYTFAERKLAAAIYRRKKEDFYDVRKVMEPLGDAFGQIAKKDQRDPVMENVQEITVGMTYGRTSLEQSYDGGEITRGFWV